MQKFTSTCVAINKLNHNVVELVLEKPENFEYQAGQYILIDTPLVEDVTDIQPRAYSLSSSPHENALKLIIKLEESGRMSNYLRETFKEGESMTFTSAMGSLTLHEKNKTDVSRPLVWIGTSSGIVPYIGHLLWLQTQEYTHNTTLIFGVKEVADFFHLELLQNLASQMENFTLVTAVSQPDETWQGATGRVTEVMQQQDTNWGASMVYACGNPAMVKDVKRICLEELGVPKAQMKVEGYV
jgi:ferredoxin-NADP reductase